MKILAVEASALVASAAITEDGILKTEFTVNNKLTHSVTLLPMIKSMCEIAGIRVEEADAIAVSAGPGSFTGLRIGAATAKGLALALNKPVIRVSTLDSMGLPLSLISDALVCPIMDARRNQVYCAAYYKGAVVIDKAACDIREFLGSVREFIAGPAEAETGMDCMECMFLGDGVDVHADLVNEELDCSVIFADAPYNRQRAANVAALGEILYRRWLMKNGLTAGHVREIGADAVTCYDDTVMCSDDLAPEYLRKPQAQRDNEAGRLEDAGLHSLKKLRPH